MSSNTTPEFPSPVGGVPLDVDFAPSILFSVLYALLVPVAIMRIINPRSRNMVLVGTLLFSTEQALTTHLPYSCVNFALRAHAAHHAGFRESKSFETYLQATLNAGFITIGQDLVTLSRSLLVSTTFGERTPEDVAVAVSVADQAVRREYAERGVRPAPLHPTFSASDFEDQPRRRFWFRQLLGYTALIFLATIILSIIAGVDYQQTIEKGVHAALVRRLLYVSSGLATALLVLLICGTLYASIALSRLPVWPPTLIAVVAALLHARISLTWAPLQTVVGVYRLTVLHNSTTSLTSTAPGSQNTTHAKVLFYIFHIAPEWLSAALLLSVNVRRTYKTGMWGDMNSEKPLPP
ncbi:hypothetical protein BV20DRAFT_980380 [Pilatotrama ljubarskyi]|nr:hypothetical protein BV20DRAFT_980380 [Pilatotrama ljubarskyi]